jgi:DNA-binding protein HU-beta
MNKADLIDSVAEAADLSKAQAGRAVDALVDAISGALKNGDQVSIIGFGSFLVRHREAIRSPSSASAASSFASAKRARDATRRPAKPSTLLRRKPPRSRLAKP